VIVLLGVPWVVPGNRVELDPAVLSGEPLEDAHDRLHPVEHGGQDRVLVGLRQLGVDLTREQVARRGDDQALHVEPVDVLAREADHLLSPQLGPLVSDLPVVPVELQDLLVLDHLVQVPVGELGHLDADVTARGPPGLPPLGHDDRSVAERVVERSHRPELLELGALALDLGVELAVLAPRGRLGLESLCRCGALVHR